MRHYFLNRYVKARMTVHSLSEENGQDLVEYAAVIALVVLAATSGMSTLANGINNAMVSLGDTINTTIG
jgi:Flp pilus assembly pilin Flp